MVVSEVHLLWLIDSDPPSEAGGGRGFYPVSERIDPPDEALMRRRLTAIADATAEAAECKAVVTLHTSPRYRTDFFEGPYPDIWRGLLDSGLELALHPHEERFDGSTFYDDPNHLRQVIGGSMDLAGKLGLPIAAFRSGTFSFHRAVPPMLAEAGIDVDLSAGPGLFDHQRNVAWPAESADPHHYARQGVAILGVPLGWDGGGCDLNKNYLFNERMDMAGLKRVFDAIRRRAEQSGRPQLVYFLAHGFGIADHAWRAQALSFVRHATAHGARLVTARQALQLHPIAEIEATARSA